VKGFTAFLLSNLGGFSEQGDRKFWTVLSVMALMLGLVAVGQVSAQIISGDLVGTILDKTGAVVLARRSKR